MKEYNINITSKLTGVSAYKLRAWEKRYNIVTPKRNSSGHRLYSENEIYLLKSLNELCNHGHNISQLKNKDLNELKELQKTLGMKDFSENKLELLDDPIIAKDTLNNLILALEAYRLDVVSHEIYNMKMKLSHRDLALNVISPLMQIVGRKVLENQIDIAQEHALSSIIRFHLGQFIYQGQINRKNEKNLFLLTTPEGDFHEFGILLSSLLCAHYGHCFFLSWPKSTY